MARQHPLELGKPDADRDTLIDTLLELMRFSMRPAVVVVDDVHRADDASLDVIRYLTRRMSGLPAMLALSYRDDDLAATHPLRRITGVLTQSDATRIRLRRLAAATVARIASSAGLDPRQVVPLVGGNPFYLAEVLAWPGPGVPPSVRDAVLSRMAQLPDRARTLLEVLSAVPGGVEPQVAARLAELREQCIEKGRCVRLPADRWQRSPRSLDHVAERPEHPRGVQVVAGTGEQSSVRPDPGDELAQQ
jgi:hypothetical protein